MNEEKNYIVAELQKRGFARNDASDGPFRFWSKKVGDDELCYDEGGIFFLNDEPLDISLACFLRIYEMCVGCAWSAKRLQDQVRNVVAQKEAVNGAS